MRTYQKHGLRKHPLHTRYANIKKRCYSKTDTAYKYYGGRGIKICDEWKDNFKAFYDWCLQSNYMEYIKGVVIWK